MASFSSMRLHDNQKNRLYINASERTRFLRAAEDMPDRVRTLCLTLLYTGCRLSEALELTAASIDLEDGLVSIRTLKKRDKVLIREVPVPLHLCELLDSVHHIEVVQRTNNDLREMYLWNGRGVPVSRMTGFRWVKRVMCMAEIYGSQATAKGLRHGFGVHAIRKGIQLNMLQKWMGHADMRTTSIYATVTGQEEREIASRMWS